MIWKETEKILMEPCGVIANQIHHKAPIQSWLCHNLNLLTDLKNFKTKFEEVESIDDLKRDWEIPNGAMLSHCQSNPSQSPNPKLAVS